MEQTILIKCANTINIFCMYNIFGLFMGFGQSNLESTSGSFIRPKLDLAAVLFYNICYIAQAQTIAFYIVPIASSRYPKEAVKNFLLVGFWYANSIIGNGDANGFGLVLQIKLYLRSLLGIFQTIIQQIKQHIRQVNGICLNLKGITG